MDISLAKLFFVGAIISQAVSGSNLDRILKSSVLHEQARVKRSPVVSMKNRDVLFVLDENVGNANFQKFTRLSTALINSFCGQISVSQERTRVGVLTFGWQVNQVIKFKDTVSKETVISKINQFTTSPTANQNACIVDTLNYPLDEMFQSSAGSRLGNPNGEGLVILMTTGCEGCVSNSTKKVAKALQDAGISTITFVVGTNTGCLNNMQEFSSGTHCYQQYSAKTWSDFDGIISMVENVPCMSLWTIGHAC